MKDKNQKNPPKDWWEAGDIFISIGMALLLLVAQILYTHQSCQPPRQTFWLGCSTPGTTGIEGGVLSAVMVFALSIIPSVLFLIISRAHYQLRLRLHELSHLNETIEASKSITTLVNFSNAYLRALHPLGTPYQSTIRALVDEGAVKHISYVPNVYLHEYYDRLGHALEHARTWAAIHQGLPKGLGNDANVLPTTLEGRMTASYFAAQKRAHDRRADLRRCIILADDEVQEFFERRNYDAFWKLTGKYVKCYLCLEQDLVGLVQGFTCRIYATSTISLYTTMYLRSISADRPVRINPGR